jgi:hypothetical protein
MLYNDLNSTTWDKLKVQSPGKYKAEILSMKSEPSFARTSSPVSKLYLFKDEKDEFHFLAENLQNIDSFSDPSVNGLELSSKSYIINDSEANYIDLRLKNEMYIQQFTAIIREICEKVLSQNIEAINAINDTIVRWKIFWTETEREEMSDTAQLGLFCELKYISHLINNNYEDPLSPWKGPNGYKHDFLFTDKAIEIKGTFSDRHTHIINGIDQLRRPEEIPLYMISFVCLKNSENSENLPDLVQTIESEFDNNPEQYENFHKLLKRAKYNRLHEEKYRNLGITVVEDNCYEVTDDFPRLTSSFLNRALSERVSGIRYTINLNDLNFTRLVDFQI